MSGNEPEVDLYTIVYVKKDQVKDDNEWVPDKTCVACPTCSKKFTFMKRKHHCRLCGGLHCTDCAPKSAAVEGEEDDLVRICGKCVKKVLEAEATKKLEAKEKRAKMMKALEEKQQGNEVRMSVPDMADNHSSGQMQQRMRMQAAVQEAQIKKGDEKAIEEEVVLLTLPDNWKEIEIGLPEIDERKWQPDDDVLQCPGCQVTFSSIKDLATKGVKATSRHHCRCCGKVYCNTCSPFVGIPLQTSDDYQQPFRACYKCVQKQSSMDKKKHDILAAKMEKVFLEKNGGANKNQWTDNPLSTMAMDPEDEDEDDE